MTITLKITFIALAYCNIQLYARYIKEFSFKFVVRKGVLRWGEPLTLLVVRYRPTVFEN